MLKELVVNNSWQQKRLVKTIIQYQESLFVVLLSDAGIFVPINAISSQDNNNLLNYNDVLPELTNDKLIEQSF